MTLTGYTQTGNDGLAAYILDTGDIAPVAGPAGRILAAHPTDSSHWRDHIDFNVDALKKDVSANWLDERTHILHPISILIGIQDK